MKQDHHHPQFSSSFHHRRPLYTWKTTTNYVRTNIIFVSYVVLFILAYAFGYFCGSSSSKENIGHTATVVVAADADTTTTVKTPSVKEFMTITNTTSLPATLPLQTDKNNDHNDFGSKCSDLVHPDLIKSMIIDRIFNGTSPYENFPPAHVAHLLKPKRVKGWGSYGAVFEKLIKKVRPKTIIEVGTFLGASATHMAELTLQLGLNTQIICVDDFRGWPGFTDKVNYVPALNGDVMLYYQFIQNVISLNHTDSILPVPFSTGSGLGKLCEWGVLGDLIEVDAGHAFHSAWSDINLAYKLLRPGGVMFGHDYFTAFDNRGVRRAVDLFAKVHGFKISTDGQHWVLVDH